MKRLKLSPDDPVTTEICQCIEEELELLPHDDSQHGQREVEVAIERCLRSTHGATLIYNDNLLNLIDNVKVADLHDIEVGGPKDETLADPSKQAKLKKEQLALIRKCLSVLYELHVINCTQFNIILQMMAGISEEEIKITMHVSEKRFQTEMLNAFICLREAIKNNHISKLVH